jgi:hypothetical protein
MSRALRYILGRVKGNRTLFAIELRISKGTLYLFLMGRGDFSRPDFGRLKPPLPQTNPPKTSFITFGKLNICLLLKAPDIL